MNTDANRKLARMHLDLAQEIYCRREALGIAVEELAEATGVKIDRIAMIEEGDTSSLTEVARLCNGLRLEMTIEDGFLIRVSPIPAIRFFAGPRQEPITTKAEPHWHLSTSENSDLHRTANGNSPAYARH